MTSRPATHIVNAGQPMTGVKCGGCNLPMCHPASGETVYQCPCGVGRIEMTPERGWIDLLSTVPVSLRSNFDE